MKTCLALPTLAVAMLSTTCAQASMWDASTSLDRFDAAIAGGLPQSLSSLAATDEAGLPTSAQLSVSAKLDTVVELPGGSVMATYLGSWNGLPATISRGDGQLLVDTETPAQAVARFDTAIASPLPAPVHLGDPSIETLHAPGDHDDLVVTGELGGDIVFADGSRGRMYDGTWHGAPVIATRSGRHLDITSQSPGGVDVTGFTSGSDEVEHASHADGFAPGDASMLTGTAADAPSRSRRSADVELVPNRLTFHMMLHDDVSGVSSQHIHAGYVAWWLADLQRNITQGKKVDILYSQKIPGVTDMPYEYVGSLHDWSDVVAGYAQEQHIPRTYKHKFMLIVKGLPELGRHGRAWQHGSEGIASINGRYPEIAHQMGHLLGAKHANAEVRYGGWWCETNMYTPSLIVRSNCYRYSRANMRLIDDYIRTGDGFSESLRWSEDR